MEGEMPRDMSIERVKRFILVILKMIKDIALERCGKLIEGLDL